MKAVYLAVKAWLFAHYAPMAATTRIAYLCDADARRRGRLKDITLVEAEVYAKVVN